MGDNGGGAVGKDCSARCCVAAPKLALAHVQPLLSHHFPAHLNFPSLTLPAAAAQATATAQAGATSGGAGALATAVAAAQAQAGSAFQPQCVPPPLTQAVAQAQAAAKGEMAAGVHQPSILAAA